MYNFVMLFTFVYSGWEGSAHDSRVFYNVVTRPENKFSFPPLGTYDKYIFLLTKMIIEFIIHTLIWHMKPYEECEFLE